jgi:hypothetical protein
VQYDLVAITDGRRDHDRRLRDADEARMTRDEAKEKLMAETRNECTPGQMDDFIDMSVALGMLKLDEPKYTTERAIDAMFARGQNGVITPRHALDAIEAAGLKIVEK